MLGILIAIVALCLLACCWVWENDATDAQLRHDAEMKRIKADVARKVIQNLYTDSFNWAVA